MKEFFKALLEIELKYKLLLFAIIVGLFTRGIGVDKVKKKRSFIHVFSLFVISTSMTWAGTLVMSEKLGYESEGFLVFSMTIISLFSSGFAEGLIVFGEKVKRDPLGTFQKLWNTIRGNNSPNETHHDYDS